MSRSRRLSVPIAGLVPIVGIATLAAVGYAVVRRVRLTTVAVAGRSMSPALEPGDFLLVRLGGAPRDQRAAGRIVLAAGPEERLLLKRVVAVPGESVRVGDAVQINGHTLDEPYAHGVADPAAYRGVHQLADAEYFVLGDRRDASTDSRDFGPVRADHIDGVAWLRYWPPARAGLLRRPLRRFLD